VSFTRRESVVLQSLRENLSGTLFLADTEERSPALVICHGAGEFKENYYELSEYLAGRGFSSLALDMHGHGASGGARYHVNIDHWVADIGAAIEFLSRHSQIDPERIGAFGLSSGGTAILEAAVADRRLKALIALDATVRNSLPFGQTLFFQMLITLAKIKRLATGSDWRIPLLKLCGALPLASDPQINCRLHSNTKALEFFTAFPLPGAAQAFFVDTIRRVSAITAPTLVVWGEDDQVDPPETARQHFAALTCKKKLEIIVGNGHMGHLDRHRTKVFELTAEWLSQNLGARPLSDGKAWQHSGNDLKRAA
jgi:uncharacterized protein